MNDERPVFYGLKALVLRPWLDAEPIPDRVISGNPEVREVYLVGDGVPHTYPVYPDKPMVILGETLWGYPVARPATPRPLDRNGYMASGAYIVQTGCFDDWHAFFGHLLPIPLHDQTERRRDS